MGEHLKPYMAEGDSGFACLVPDQTPDHAHQLGLPGVPVRHSPSGSHMEHLQSRIFGGFPVAF